MAENYQALGIETKYVKYSNFILILGLDGVMLHAFAKSKISEVQVPDQAEMLLLKINWIILINIEFNNYISTYEILEIFN